MFVQEIDRIKILINKTDIKRYLISVQNHKERFVSIEQKLDIFYSEYKNKRKIIKLVYIWLFFVKALHDTYGIDVLKAFLLSEFNCPNRFAINYELGVDLNNKQNPYKFKYLFYIFINFLSKPLLPGAIVNGVLKKLRWRFAKWIISQIPEKSDLSRKNEFINYIIEYFDNSFDGEFEQLIKNAIPTVFYSKPVKTLIKSNLILEGSPWSIFDFQGFERIFLIQRPVTIKGSQHGGGHNTYISEVGEDIEEELADTYYGWGLSENLNHRQPRYSKRERKLTKNTNGRRVLWIEKARVSTWCKFVWPYQYQVWIESETVKYIANELQNAQIEYYNLPHTHNDFRSNKYDGLRGKELDNLTGLGEDIIGNNDIVIFDIITSSLIHYCIEHEILFIFVVPRSSVEYYTSNQKEWFDVMRNANLVFYNDENDRMGKALIKLIDSKAEMPIELRKYHNRKFINI